MLYGEVSTEMTVKAIHVMAAVAAVVFLFGSGLAVAKPVVTQSGSVVGVREGGVTAYKGIPFAAPPVGALRWMPPQPPLAWEGVRKATAFAPACLQTGVSMPGETPPVVSEDCLALNIWTPAPRAGQRLPVLVWIHGGGYTNGSAAMPLYWGDRLARRGIVVVSVAYRLGVFGFLAHPQLTAESARHGSGNYGLMDQMAALQWVQKNIAAFGGDPARVTIAGQSAGAMSVSLLLASPRAKGLFHGAIGQSGGVFEPEQLAPSYQLANAERDGEKYAASVGAGSIRELRALPASALLTAAAAALSHPVIEPDVLPLTPYAAYRARQHNAVPLLIGSNAEEARSLVDVSAVKAATFAADIERRFGKLPAPLLAAYATSTDAQAQQARLDFERDLRFGWDMWAWARLQALAGKQPVYFYRFAQRPPFPAGSVYANWGAGHFAELWYMFDHLEQARWRWSAADQRLAQQMASYWVNFVKRGDPSGKGLPQWPRYAGEGGAVMQLAAPLTVERHEPGDGLRVFDRVYEQVRGAAFWQE